MQQVAPAAPRASAASSSPGASPTIAIRAGSSPSASSSRARNGPFRSVRSPRTSSLPVTTIAARGRLNGPRQATSRVGVTTSRHGSAAPASATALAARATDATVLGRADARARSPCPSERLRLARARSSPGEERRRSAELRWTGRRHELPSPRARASWRPAGVVGCGRATSSGCRRTRGVELGAAELPRGDHERRRRTAIPTSAKHDHVPLDPPWSRPAYAPTGRAGDRRRVLALDDEAGVVLVDVELAVEAEELGVGPQEALDVRSAPAASSNCSSSSARRYFDADLRRQLGLREVDPLAEPRLAEAVADLEHARMILERAVAAARAVTLRAGAGARRSRRASAADQAPRRARAPDEDAPTRAVRAARPADAPRRA